MTSRRRLLRAGAALAAVLVSLAVPSAIAANQSVMATPGNVFSPKLVAVKPGESVTVTNQGGEHNVVWNDGGAPTTPAQPAEPTGWPASGVTRTFTRSGRFRYFCANHGDRSLNVGMYGYVYVNSAGLLPPTLSGVVASGSSAGARLRFRASRAGRVAATFFRKVGRRFNRFGSTSFAARRGANSKLVSHAGRALTSGAYRVELVLTDANRLKSDKRSDTFRIP